MVTFGYLYGPKAVNYEEKFGIKIIINDSRGPWTDKHEFVEGVLTKKEMSTDLVEYLDRHEYPFEHIPTEEFKKWAKDNHIDFVIDERRYQIVEKSTLVLKTIYGAQLRFDDPKHQMMFRLAWK